MAAGLFGCDDGFCIDLKSAELDDPASGGTWAAEASMSRAHVGHTATALSSGWVPVAVGGTARVELYEPSIATWVTPAAAQHRARADGTATLLSDGRVLSAGGSGPDGTLRATAELYPDGPRPARRCR